MNMDWFDSIDNETLIVMQTNNSPHFEGHINVCEDFEEMIIKYKMHTLYKGELETPVYTRYMQIGFKA